MTVPFRTHSARIAMASRIRFILTVLLLAGFVPAISPTAQAQITEKPAYGRIAITNAEVHTVSGEVIPGGVVLIENDIISFVGSNVKAPDFDSYHQIDGSGKRLYPGFIDSGSLLGLVEINAVPVTVDYAEVGNFNPEMLAFTAINPHASAIPVTRVEGVTTVVSAPQSGRIPGKATLIDLWGYSPDSMAVLKEAALVLEWPSVTRGGQWDSRSASRVAEQYRNYVEELDEFIDRAAFYSDMMDAYEANPAALRRPDRDPKMEAMRPVVNGELPIVISVDREKDILNAIEWTRKHPDNRFVLAGVREGWRVADSIAAAGIPVIVNTLYTPVRSYDDYQRPYQNPGMMHQAGVKVLFSSFESENVRNLAFNAGYAATYGMEFGFGPEEAIRALTLNPAEVWGVGDRLGSIEVGKQANLILVDGDPLETTSQVSNVIIRGREIPMVSRHTQLHEEFLDRNAVRQP